MSGNTEQTHTLPVIEIDQTRILKKKQKKLNRLFQQAKKKAKICYDYSKEYRVAFAKEELNTKEHTLLELEKKHKEMMDAFSEYFNCKEGA